MSLCLPKIYKRRNPQTTLLFQIVLNYLEDWLANYFLKNNETLPGYVENEYRDYFKCGILCHGFARARCKCGTDFVIAFSCKRRVCPSCNTKHMFATATHIISEVLPKLPVRQWVLSVPKWIRYFLARDSDLVSQVLRIFIYEIHKKLKISIGKKISDDAKLGAISFIQRFGSALNLHIHYHCVVMDGIFCEDAEGLLQFLEVDDLSIDDSDAVQTRVRKRVLSLYKRRRLITAEDAENLKSWKGGGGFSVNADVLIDTDDRQGLERLLRYCARPAFSGEKLTAISTFGEKADAMRLLYDVNKNSQGIDRKFKRTFFKIRGFFSIIFTALNTSQLNLL